MTQDKAIEQHLGMFGSITSFEAFKDYGITRLSAIIFRLRHEKNLNIVGEPQTTKNRFGNPVTYHKYKLKK